MKIKCNFCQTEYTLDKVPTTSVRCPVCGRVWVAQAPNRKNSLLVFFAALCALLAAIVFSVAMISQHNMSHQRGRPLVAKITANEIIYDTAGVPHFKVFGTVKNQSDEIYGMPDIVIVSYDGDGNVINRQQFAPTATLMDAGAVVNFNYTLSIPSSGTKKITAELADIEK